MQLRIWIYGLDGRVLGRVEPSHAGSYTLHPNGSATPDPAHGWDMETVEQVRNRASQAVQRLEAQGLKVLRVVEELRPDDEVDVATEEARKL